MASIAVHLAVLSHAIPEEEAFSHALLLQGHCRAITAVAASQDRSLLITADKGTNSMLVFWDPVNGQPIRTLQPAHAAGVAAVAVSPDASQMATLSAVAGPEDVQEVSATDWQHQSTTHANSWVHHKALAATTDPAAL